MRKYPDVVNWSNRFYVVKGRNRRLKVEVTCPDCGMVRFVDRRSIDSGIKLGSFTGRCKRCARHLRGEKAPGWDGGRHLGSSGRYFYQTVTPDHPYFCMANSRSAIAEHRLVMAEHLGRPLRSDEHIHHIDGNRTNNDVSNLMILDNSEHIRIEMLIRLGQLSHEEVQEYALAIGA